MLPGEGKPTIYEALVAKLGREPTNAEVSADVKRIIREARDMVRNGKVPVLASGGRVIRR